MHSLYSRVGWIYAPRSTRFHRWDGVTPGWKSSRCATGRVVLIAGGLFAGAAAGVAIAATPGTVRKEIAEIRAELARHDVLYHQKSAPEISDAEYDRLRRRLRALEAAHPAVAAEIGGALPEIGDDRTGFFPTVRHHVPMPSLEKANSEAEVRAFHARLARLLRRDDLTYLLEPKYDGLAISVVYEKGRLVRAVTRGNGIEGDDVTANLGLVRGLPRELRRQAGDGSANAIPDLIELRGEIFVGFAEFQRLNAELVASGQPAFTHPRHLAAGSLRQSKPDGMRRLEIAFFGTGACEPAALQPERQRDWYELFRRWGLPAVGHLRIARGTDEAWSAIRELGRLRAEFGFPTDGAVLKLDSLAGQRRAGNSGTTPRWLLGFKYAPAQAETRVNAIAVQVGRTGVLTPVAELEPVELAGSTVARATLHNREALAKRDVRVGDFVVVEKAGDVIPAIVEVNKARRIATLPPYVFPTSCPACESAVASPAGEVLVRCPNFDCPAQVRRRLEHFASRDAVDIAGLGPATIDALVDSQRVKDPADFYRLTRADFNGAGHAGEGSVARVLAAIAKSRRAELWRFVYGLGIPRVGIAGAKEAAQRFGRLEALFGADTTGDGLDRTIAAYVAGPQQRLIIERLIAAGIQPRGATATGPLAGKVFVLTGTLPHLTRTQATERIESTGGRVASAVTKVTDYVVAGEDPGAKLVRARELGVAVLDEDGLRELLESTR